MVRLWFGCSSAVVQLSLGCRGALLGGGCSSAAGIRHREREAILPIAGLELTLEVRGPSLVWPSHLQTKGYGLHLGPSVGFCEDVRVDKGSR